jgi:hypothetical protein
MQIVIGAALAMGGRRRVRARSNRIGPTIAAMEGSSKNPYLPRRLDRRSPGQGVALRW